MAEAPELRAGRVRDALRTGFPISCASCDHLHRAWETNAVDCGKTATCGGPIFGKAYPDYKGPLPEQAFEKLCLICGKDRIDYHVVLGPRRFGLCFSHRAVFDKISDLKASKPLIVLAPGRVS